MSYDIFGAARKQREQLKVLATLNPDQQMYVQLMDKDRSWLPVEEYLNSSRVVIAKFRSVLSNELIFEIDSEDHEKVYQDTKKIIDWLKEHNAPNYLTYSGNKSFHIRVYLDRNSIKLDDGLVEQLKRYNIDALKELRLFFYDLVRKGTGTDPDRSMFSWGSSTKGHMERLECSIHEKSSGYCSYIEELTLKKPEITEPKLMPVPPKLWDVSAFQEAITKHFVRVIDDTAKDDIAPIGPITLDVEDPFNDTPCMKAFIGNGVEQGHRHSMVYSMATLSKWTSIPKERAQEAIKEALEKSKADNARIDSEMKNVESLYTNEKRKFSCKTLREEFEGFCDKEHCPVWKGITPKKKGKKGKNGKEEDTKEEKEKLSFRSHLEKEGRLYLEVFTKDQEFKFAFLNDAGEIELIDRIETEPYPTVPVKLPMRNGEYMRVVKMPDDDILTAPLLSPEELLKEIEGHIRKYCDMNELDIKMVTYYVLFTWFYEKVNTCGVLRFLADTGKGKSRMNTVTGDLSFYPLSVAGSGSLSGAMRQNELWRGTMIMDEADFEKGKEGAWTKYINLGFEKGKYFALSDKQNPKYQEWFDPYSPKIIAMREPFRDNATEGRLISISPYETTSLDIPVILEDDYQKEAMTLRNKIAKFVILHWNDVDGKKMVDFKDLGLEPRLRQLAMPISIIFQLWEEGVEEFRNYLTKRQLEIKKVRALSWEGSVFNFVYSLASGEGDVGDEFEGCHDADGELLAVTPSMVAKAFNTTAKNVTDALRSIGFEVEHDNIVVSRRVGEEIKGKRKTIRKYVLPNENTWNEIVRRYYYNEDNGIEIPEIPEILEGKHYFIPFIQKKIDEKNVTYVTNVTDPHTEKKNEQPVLGNNLLDLQNSSSRFVEKSEANFLTYTKNPVCRSVTSVTSVTESQKNETDQPEDLLKNDPQVIGYENKLREIFNHSSDKNSFLNIAWHETGLDSGKLKKVWEELRGSFHYTDETEQTGDLSKKLIEIAKECGATASNGASAAEVIMKAVEKGIKKDEAIQVFHDLQISGLIRECALGRFVLEGSS